jgi:hypothetical protein
MQFRTVAGGKKHVGVGEPVIFNKNEFLGKQIVLKQSQRQLGLKVFRHLLGKFLVKYTQRDEEAALYLAEQISLLWKWSGYGNLNLVTAQEIVGFFPDKTVPTRGESTNEHTGTLSEVGGLPRYKRRQQLTKSSVAVEGRWVREYISGYTILGKSPNKVTKRARVTTLGQFNSSKYALRGLRFLEYGSRSKYQWYTQPRNH